MTLDWHTAIPYRQHEEIRHAAEAFLKQHHPLEQVPVPIESIVDLKLGINIVPLNGLRSAFEVDGFTSSDLTEITVDMLYMHPSYENRYRFTLAHELGHRELHKDVYLASQFSTTDEWKAFQKSIPDLVYGRMEWQAYEFAGLLLVPTPLLKRVHAEAQVAVPDEVRRTGLGAEAGFIDELVINRIAAVFSVSKDVIRYRLKAEAKRLARKPS